MNAYRELLVLLYTVCAIYCVHGTFAGPWRARKVLFGIGAYYATIIALGAWAGMMR